jgi:hypothetical protein
VNSLGQGTSIDAEFRLRTSQSLTWSLLQTKRAPSLQHYNRGFDLPILTFPMFALLETPAALVRTVLGLVGAGDEELTTRTLHGSAE